MEKGVVPLKRRVSPSDEERLPIIANIVTTLSFLAHGESRLPLEAISMQNGPCSQYAPVQFAANILKHTDTMASSTALVFASGKCVIVSALTEMHSVFLSHVFRLNIERTQCMMIGPDGTVRMGTLKGKTALSNFQVRNIVGYGNLNIPLDLKRLRATYPDAVKYFPDQFPAAKINVWLTPDQKCHCSTTATGQEDEEAQIVARLGKMSKQRCGCTIKCLCYDTGCVVMIGGRSVRDINQVFDQIQDLLRPMKLSSQEASHNLEEESDAPKKQLKTITTAELMPFLLGEARNFKTKRLKLSEKCRAPPFIRLCEAGRLHEVESALLFDPTQRNDRDEHGYTALQRLEHMERNTEQEAVYCFLKR